MVQRGGDWAGLQLALQAPPAVPNVTSHPSTASVPITVLLKKLKGMVILPTDKGKATVVLDKEEYMSKVKLVLSDTKTYLYLLVELPCLLAF